MKFLTMSAALAAVALLAGCQTTTADDAAALGTPSETMMTMAEADAVGCRIVQKERAVSFHLGATTVPGDPERMEFLEGVSVVVDGPEGDDWGMGTPTLGPSTQWAADIQETSWPELTETVAGETRTRTLTSNVQEHGSLVSARYHGGLVEWNAQRITMVGKVAWPDGTWRPCVTTWSGQGSVPVSKLGDSGRTSWDFPGGTRVTLSVAR